MEIQRLFNRAQVDDRLVNELVGLARGLVADGVVNQGEAEYLQRWLVANAGVTSNPVVNNLLGKIGGVLADGVLDGEEAQDLLETLSRFAGGEFELGEVMPATTLPLDDPPPRLEFDGARYCFTGTFAFGGRKDCEGAVKAKGATVGGLSQQTRYLVVGVYATDSWVHSAFGRKIEQAVAWRNEGRPISLVSELWWVDQMGGV